MESIGTRSPGFRTVLLSCLLLTACQVVDEETETRTARASATGVETAPSIDAMGRFYTFDPDFDEGTLDDVNHDTPAHHQLQINQVIEIDPYIWIANWVDGTVTKIDTRTGKQLAKYDSVLVTNWDGTKPNVRPPRESGSFSSTPPCGNTPSRTAVDGNGDAFVANRTFCGVASATKFAGGLDRCVDRNGNGVIDTSNDANGNGLINMADPSEFKGQADECILWTKNYGVQGAAGRSAAVDGDQNLWAGTYSDSKLFKLDGQTGAILQTIDPNAETGRVAYLYGIAIGPGGFIYTSDISNARLRKIDPNAAPGSHVVAEAVSPRVTYGISVDRNGVVWLGNWGGSGGVIRVDFSVAPPVVTNPGAGDPSCPALSRGTAVDGDGNVWVACWTTSRLLKFSGAGALLGSWPVAAGPIGVAIDADGMVWTANQSSDTASRLDPATGVVNSYPTTGQPYSYSDMTGFQRRNVTLREGHWTVIHDSGTAGVRWGTVTWNKEPQGSTPPGTSIVVDVRAADDPAALPGLPYVRVDNGVEFGGVNGKYVQIRATLRIEQGNISPVLSDLGIEPANRPPVALCQDVDTCNDRGMCQVANASIDAGSYDPDGDPITLVQAPPPPYPVGTTEVTLTVSDGTERDQCDALVTVHDCEPPNLICPPPVTRECVDGGARVDMPPGRAWDNCRVTFVTDPPERLYLLGVTEVPYVAVDSAMRMARCMTTVTVVDTQPPVVIPRDGLTMWPPNHKMEAFTLSDCAAVRDSCQGPVDIDLRGRIVSIYSDEPEDVGGGGDGHTLRDIVISGRSTFELRAERQGGNNGRVYGVRFVVTDESGNETPAVCHFAVPHDQSGRPAVDDGPGAGYTVYAP